MRGVPLDRPWKDINRYSFFDFLTLVLIFEKILKFWAAKYKKPVILLLVRITVCMCTNRDLAIQTKIVQSFDGFLKVSQALGRKDSIQTVILTSRRLDSFCMKRLTTLKSFKIFWTEIKKSKTYSGWPPCQGLSNGTALVKIQSSRMVPLSVLNKFFWCL